MECWHWIDDINRSLLDTNIHNLEEEAVASYGATWECTQEQNEEPGKSSFVVTRDSDPLGPIGVGISVSEQSCVPAGN